MSMRLQFLRSRRLLWLPPVLVGVGVLAFFIRGKRELPRKEIQEVAVPIRVIEIKPKDIVPSATGFGSASPSRKWSAVAEVSGRVVEVNPRLESGNVVQAGELLFRIDPDDYALQLSQRESDLAVANAQLAETIASETADQRSLEIEKSLLAVSQKELDRQLGLRGQQIVSDSELENARMNVLKQQQAVQRLKNTLSLYVSRKSSAEAQVRLAESRVKEAQRNLERTQITSPYTGTLAGVSVELGQVVAPNQNLFELHDTSTVEVESHFSISQLQRLLPDGKHYSANDQLASWLPKLTAVLTTESGGSKQVFRGQPIRITESLDTQTRTLGVVVAVQNSSMQANAADVLRAGTFCEVELRSESRGGRIAVPRLALDGEAVYEVDEDSRLHRRPVSIESFIGDTAVIASGLQVGQWIASQPPVPAIEGMLVAPEEAR